VTHTLALAAAWLPHGNTLPREILVARHRGILVLLWAHVPALSALAMVTQGGDLVHTVVDVLPVAVLAFLASRRPFERPSRRVFATLGLLLASADGVHLTGGLIEAHFHFFLVVAVIALYQDWVVFLLAIAFVAVHHAAASVLVPKSVFNHADALEHPVRWALIHAAFVLGIAMAHVIAWRASERSSHDSLTGLASAGLLVHRLDQALDRGPATVIYLDLDGFKSVNDRLGHPSGDRLLADVARRMETVVRSESGLGRMGGDEFAVILPGADAEQGCAVARRLIEEMARPFLLPAGNGHIGASAGVAPAGRGSTAEQVLAAADAALYEAKEAGKGRLAVADFVSQVPPVEQAGCS
jgi:diguanylate cyclase (GGDEF)-like protein